MDLTKSNSETNFKVRILNFWLMSFLFFIYQESGFLTSTAVAVSISSVSQKEVKRTEDTHFQRGMYNTKVGLYDHAITEFQEVLKLTQHIAQLSARWAQFIVLRICSTRLEMLINTP